MTLSYLLRLTMLSLATFTAVNLVATLLIRLFARRILHRAETMASSRAAQLTFFWRLFPAAVAIFCVIAFCVPSYLWLEPEADSEAAGYMALAAAAMGAGMWIFSLSRSCIALHRSREFARREFRTGRLVALTGIFRARVLVSDEVLATLSGPQLDAAMRHELAHRSAFDNLKQLVMKLAPGFALNDLELGWRRFSEWAADDAAVAGDRDRAMELASALVAVARLHPVTPPILTAALIEDDAVLAERVHRLIEPGTVSSQGRSRLGWLLLATAGAALAATPFALPWVHRALERLMD